MTILIRYASYVFQFWIHDQRTFCNESRKPGSSPMVYDDSSEQDLEIFEQVSL